jgi:hypothetical protein
MITAKLLVASGGSDSWIGGGVSLPSQVNCLGTVAPSLNAGLETAKGIVSASFNCSRRRGP